MKKLINTFFQLDKHKSSLTKELIAGFTTFCTMTYIIVVNPSILHASGMNQQSVFVATCLIAMLGTLFVGLVANYPIAVAPSMGINAYFSYVLVQHLGFSWQTSLGFVFISGILFMLATATKVRQKIIRAIPNSLNLAIAAGLGLLIAMIALQNSGLLITSENHFFTLGHISGESLYLPLFGLILIFLLNRFKIPGAILISIIAVTIFEIATGSTKYLGFFSMPPSITPTFAKLHIETNFNHLNVSVILSLFVVIFFDSTGTLIGLLQGEKHLSEPSKQKNFYRALFADSIATTVGAILGTASTSPYMESATGMKAGGKTGLTAVTVAILFFLTLFFSPLVQTIPANATTAALLYVGILMLSNLKFIDWKKPSEYVPALITSITIGTTFSIANGIGLGFICYMLLKLLGKKKEVLTPTNIILTILFALYFIGTFYQ